MSISYNSSIVTNGLVLCLDAANPRSYPGSGSVWYDVSGNGRNLTLQNGPTFDGSNSGSLIFDGVDDWANTTDNGIGVGSRLPHSIDMWVNFNVITSTRWWLAVLGQFGQGAHHWIGSSPTQTQFGTWAGACQRNPDLIGNNIWLNIVSTYDGTNLILYVNLNPTASCEATDFNFTNSEFTLGLRIGAESYFNGKIATAKLYNRALSAAEITQNFNALRGRYGI
jgi:hypothetical protein